MRFPCVYPELAEGRAERGDPVFLRRTILFERNGELEAVGLQADLRRA